MTVIATSTSRRKAHALIGSAHQTMARKPRHPVLLRAEYNPQVLRSMYPLTTAKIGPVRFCSARQSSSVIELIAFRFIKYSANDSYLTRVMNIIGVKPLIAAIQAA
jgi:hypothetical protein